MKNVLVVASLLIVMSSALVFAEDDPKIYSDNETELRSEESLLTISEAAWTSGIDNMKNPKHRYEETASGVRQLYLWMRIRGQERALERLDSQGKLPIQHLWIYSTGISQIGTGNSKLIDAVDLTVGKKEKLSKLRLELKQRGFFNWRTWSMKKNLINGWWTVKILYSDLSPVFCNGQPCVYEIEVK